MNPISSRFGPPAFYREALAIALPVMLQQLIMSMVSLSVDMGKLLLTEKHWTGK
jgi:Na+-driven multidrug efflux pump